MDIQSFGKILLIIGGLTACIGLALLLGGKYLSWLGRLPGDFRFQNDSISFFFPLTTSIILSIILTIVLNVIIRLLNR